MSDQPLTATEISRLSGQRGEHFVGGVAGLSLRVGGRTASWVLRGRIRGSGTVRTWTVGRYPDMPPSQARTRAGAALDMAREGTDPAEWLRGMLPARAAKAAKPDRPAPMDWAEAVEAFLSAKGETTRATTVRSYRLNLLHGAIPFATVADASQDGVRRLLNAWVDAGKLVQARNVLRDLRIMLRWCEGRPECGAPKGTAEALEGIEVASLSPARAREKALGRVPSPEALGEALWRLDEDEAPLHVRLGVALLLLTAQRIRTLLMTEAEEFRDGQWHIPGAHMKSGRALVLPLGPWGWSVAEALLRAAPKARGPLFPGVRPKRAGGAVGAFLSYRSIAGPFADALPGHTPHAARYALATHGEEALGLRRIALQGILDHAEASVFEKNYSLGERHAMKLAAMRAWEGWLLGLAGKDGRLPRFLPPAPAA